MSTSREKILNTLLSRQRCTINELAEIVGINPISIRHHIIKLQAEGLVTANEERHGVGRPRRYYFLTESGAEKFPTRYLNLTNRLLDSVKDVLPKAEFNLLLSQMGEDMAAGIADDVNIDSLSLEQRLDLVKGLLESEGFTVEWERKGEEYHIRELSCPYLHVGQSHPEVCNVDQTLISNLLSVPTEKLTCILDGDAHCTYVVNRIDLTEIDLSSLN